METQPRNIDAPGVDDTDDAGTAHDIVDRAVHAMARVALSAAPLAENLGHVAETAREVTGAWGAGITTLERGRPSTVAATHEEMHTIDKAQYASGRGPCLDSYRSQAVVTIDSTEHDPRYPEFVATARDHGVRSTLSVPLVVAAEGVGALNLYSREEHGFGDEARALALRFAEPAATALVNARLVSDATALAAQLEEALATRGVIERAKGILMARQGVDADTAFDLLRRASQRENVKVREIAARLDSTTGAGPPVPG